MTPERAKELLPIITAFANGEVIECRLRGTNHNWITGSIFGWSANHEYRIKPRVPEYRLFQYIEPNDDYRKNDGLVVVCTRNTAWSDSVQGMEMKEHRISQNRGKWLTEWLPIPNYQE